MRNTLIIKNNDDFAHVIKKGKWFSGNIIMIYALKNNYNNNEIGISVGKKFSKSSVKRNRVKRLIKEAYRLNESKIGLGNSIIFIIKNNVDYEKLDFQSVEKDLIRCFGRAKLLNNKEDVNA